MVNSVLITEAMISRDQSVLKNIVGSLVKCFSRCSGVSLAFLQAMGRVLKAAFLVAINPAVNAGSVCAVFVRKRFDGGTSQPFLSFSPDGFSYFVGYFATALLMDASTAEAFMIHISLSQSIGSYQYYLWLQELLLPPVVLQSRLANLITCYF